MQGAARARIRGASTAGSGTGPEATWGGDAGRGRTPVVQPPYALKLNPVERFFRDLRRVLGERVAPTLQGKQNMLEPILKVWQMDPERVRPRCGWAWMRDALTALPADTQVS